MNTHPYVTQLRFARSEFMRGVKGVSDDEAQKQIGSLNCISWIVGHMANQEHFFWVRAAQGRNLAPELNDLVGTGKPPSVPSFPEMRQRWAEITAAADTFLNDLDAKGLRARFTWNDKPFPEDVGTLLLRNTYHYWYHLGEALSLRQLLGHASLPEFVGDMSEVRFE